VFKSLRIRKFQSHEDTFLEFSPFVNVLQGLSTVGKSSVLRAKRLLVDNRPSGARFFSNFAGDKGETIIDLELPEGKVEIIKDVRTTKKGEKELKSTTYNLEVQGEKFSFTGVGESVPDQVKELLNLSELNDQRQFDSPFLISTSAGEIARTINRITNLEKVDEWVSTLSSKINDVNRSIISYEEDIKFGEIELARYADLDETGLIVNKLSATQGELNSLQIKHSHLDRDLVVYEEKYRTQENLKAFLKAEKYISRADKLQRDIDLFHNLMSQLSKYDNLKNEKQRMSAQLSELEPLLGKIEKSSFDTRPFNRLNYLYNAYLELSSDQKEKKKIFTEFSGLSSKIVTIDKTRLQTLDLLLEDYRLFQANCEEGNGQLKEARKRYMSLLKESRRCPGILHCSLTDNQMKEVEKSL